MGDFEMSLTIDTSNEAIIAVGICKLGALKYEITSGSELNLKPENSDDLKASAVVDFLVKEVPSVLGSDDKEQEEAKLWASKKTNIGELNKHLNLRVYIADGLEPTIADLTVFANLREQIIKQKAPQRNQFVNVTRWFNHLQSLFEPHFSTVAIKLAYTAPKKPEKKKQDKKQNNQNQRRAPPPKVTGFARLRLQVGKIVSIEVHPTVESLYVEKIDLGEETPRTVVSKLAEKIPIEEMKDRLVVVATNLSPATLQGVESCGLVFCASIGESVEVLTPPEGSKIGEQIQVKGLQIQPDTDPITRKVFSKALKGLKTNDSCVACYKDVPLSTESGNVFVKSLKGAEIK